MELSKVNELLSLTETVNRQFDTTGNLLCLLVAQVEKEEAFKEAGYESANEYVIDRLGKSKGNASMLLSVGRMALEAGFTPQTIEEVQPAYYRLYLARSELKNGFDSVIAHASTLSEQELTVKKKTEDAGPHTPDYSVCKVCGVDKWNHE